MLKNELPKESYWRIKDLGKIDYADKTDDEKAKLKKFILRVESAIIIDTEIMDDFKAHAPEQAEGLTGGFVHGLFSIWNNEQMRVDNVQFYAMGILKYPVLFLSSSQLERISDEEAHIAHAKAQAEYLKTHDNLMPENIIKTGIKNKIDDPDVFEDDDKPESCKGCSGCAEDADKNEGSTMPEGSA